MRALHRDRELRYPTAEEMQEDPQGLGLELGLQMSASRLRAFTRGLSRGFAAEARREAQPRSNRGRPGREGRRTRPTERGPCRIRARTGTRWEESCRTLTGSLEGLVSAGSRGPPEEGGRVRGSLWSVRLPFLSRSSRARVGGARQAGVATVCSCR